jgi:FkbM family methyltransferase
MKLIEKNYYLFRKINFLKWIYHYTCLFVGRLIKIVRIQGFKIYAPSPLLRGSMFIKRGYELETTNLINKLIKPGEVFVDVGANVGYYSLLAARKVGKTGKVYAFEPVKKNFIFLKKNIQLNNFKNIIPINKAVSNFEGKKRIFLSKDDGQHSFRKVGKSSLNVSVTTIDNFFKKISKIDWIKIDTEGSEGFVIEGAKKIIKKNKNIKIILEFMPKFLLELGYPPLKLLNNLHRLGFQVFIIEEKGLKQITKNNQNFLLSSENPINLFCQRK